MGFIGQQFALPQQNYEVPVSPQMTGPQRQAEAFNEGLLGMDEEVTGYFKDYGALQNFAHGMWQQYQIDVTAPDPTNPASIEAYKMYLQGLAQVQERGNTMKQRQQQFNAAYARSLADPNIRFAEGMTPETFEPGQVRNLAPTTMASKVGERYGRSVKSKEELAQLEAYKNNALAMLEEDLKEATDSRNKAEIQADIDYVKSLEPTYDPTFDKALIADYAKLKASQSKQKVFVSSRWDEINRIQAGDKGFFNGYVDSKGSPIFPDVKYDRSQGIMWLRPQGSGKPVKIDLTTEDGGARQINTLLNRFATDTDEKVAFDELKGYGQSNNLEVGLSPEARRQVAEFDHTGINNVQKALTDINDKYHLAVYEQLNDIAAGGGLIFPDDERGLFGVQISSIEFNPEISTTHDKIEIMYSRPEMDDDGTPTGELVDDKVVLDTSNKKDQMFLDQLLKVNSDDVDYTRYTNKYYDKTFMQTPDGQTVAVDQKNVSKMLNNGYIIIN